MGISFNRLTTVTADTKRRADPRNAPTVNLQNIKITPLMPVDKSIAFRMGLETPHELLQAFTSETDIREGDYLVIGAAEYPVKAVGSWAWRPDGGERLVVLVEELK